MEVVQVQPRDSYLHNIYIPTTGTVIRWTFTTKKNNISFGLYRRKGKDPLPNSSETILRVKQQLQKRQMSFSIGETAVKHEHDEDNEGLVSTNSTQTSSTQSTTNRPRSKSFATAKLKERGLDEIIPIQHTHSCDQKVEGSYVVDEPGNYVLVFDNTFSRNTAKILSFSVALGDPTDLSVSNGEIAGWLLKKKRKRMQGWAKRWFSLSPAGVLSYSTGQNTVIRGSIQILISSITYSPKLNQIHIDSGTMIYHLKTLTQDDYTLWSSALKEIKDNSDDVLRAIPAEYNAFNSATNSKRNSYRGMSMYGNNYQLDRKLKAEVEQGLDFSSDLQSNAIAFVKAVDELKHFVADLVIDDNEKMLDIFYKIDLGKQKMISGLDDQLHQWQNIQNAISSKRRSGSNSPKLASAQETALMEQSEHPPRTSSVYSELSGYSETFFDAEDIVLSAAEDEDEEDSHIDDEENSSDEDDTDSHPDSEILKLTSMADCNRRSKLPSPSLGDPGSALSVFKKNIGKDLSTIAMPISMNEPLSMLQKACEELEYSDILDKAAGLTDPIERLMYVTVFSISAYASSQYRTGRKPFNPMMNETYECIRPDRGFRFISEKVSHNPLIVAAHAESKNFKYWQSTQIKSKFWGKSMEFMTEGNFHIVLTGHDDHFVFFKPSSWMKNMIAGEKYLEHSGECKVMNQKTGDYATVVFKEGTGGGLFSTPTKRNDVIATLHNKDGAKVRRIVGKWSDKLLEEVNMDKNKLNVLWSAQPSGVPECEKYFGFTRFATELNEITSLEKDKIPITDTRLRPDQRLYENGKVDEADEEKLRIEQKQRERRKMFELSGTEWKPRWFTCEDGEWQYAGQYWPTRESGKWPSDLFEIW